MASMIASLVSSGQTSGNFFKKCEDTAIKASFGHLVNQSMVQPEKRPGNLRDLSVGFKVVGSKKVKNFVFEKSLKPTFVGIFHRQARNRERCVGWHGRERRRNRRDCLAWAESLVRPFS